LDLRGSAVEVRHVQRRCAGRGGSDVAAGNLRTIDHRERAMRPAHEMQRTRHRRGARARLAAQQHDREIGHEHASHDCCSRVRKEGKFEVAPAASRRMSAET
jgi:hypothetical protein